MNPKVLFPGVEGVIAHVAMIGGTASVLCEQLAVKVADALVHVEDPALASRHFFFIFFLFFFVFSSRTYIFLRGFLLRVGGRAFSKPC